MARRGPGKKATGRGMTLIFKTPRGDRKGNNRMGKRGSTRRSKKGRY